MNLQVTLDKQIRHPSGTKGIVITREQTITDTDTGDQYKAYFWHNWSTPDCRLVKVTDTLAFNA